MEVSSLMSVWSPFVTIVLASAAEIGLGLLSAMLLGPELQQ